VVLVALQRQASVYNLSFGAALKSSWTSGTRKQLLPFIFTGTHADSLQANWRWTKGRNWRHERRPERQYLVDMGSNQPGNINSQDHDSKS
jgi:hypothetical protein